MKRSVGLKWSGVIAVVSLVVPITGWPKDIDPIASMTLDCSKDLNKKCEECGYTGTDHDPPCCRKPDDCEVINKPLPPIVAIKKPKPGHVVAPIKGAVKPPPKKIAPKSPATELKSEQKMTPGTTAESATKK
jgi:hypothetical protein